MCNEIMNNIWLIWIESTKICDLKWASFWLNINTGVTYLHTCLYMLINISHHIMLLMSQLHAPIFNTYNTCTKHIRWYILLHVNTYIFYTLLKLFRCWSLFEYKSCLKNTFNAYKQLVIHAITHQYFPPANILKLINFM